MIRRGVVRWLRAAKSRVRSLEKAMRPESGITIVELTIVALITTILIASLVTAMRSVVGGTLVAKERDRALALAQDKLDAVKKRGYKALETKVSLYVYPTDSDPSMPLSQKSELPPYPDPPPLVPEEDRWTPEYIRLGRTWFWRHVTIKFVEETPAGLVQKPEPNPPTDVGGDDSSAGLMHIEVAVTWFSRVANRMRQVRVTSLLANLALPITNIGIIAGTVFDDSDDLPITGKSLIVNATNQGTGKTYSVTVDPTDGEYSIESLPDGAYVVKVVGPGYAVSAYAFPAGNPSPPSAQGVVYIVVGDKQHYDIEIWTTKLARVKIFGKFKGADVGDTVYIDSADGLSSGTSFEVGPGDDCKTATPCSFTIDDVLWPVTGTKTFNLTLENRTIGKFMYATICMDSAALPIGGPPGSATDLNWGEPPAPPAYIQDFQAACSCGPTPCQQPSFATILDIDEWDNTPAEVKVHVKEYFNGSPANLKGAFVYVTDGVSATAFTAASGKVTVTNVAPSEAGTVKVIVSMPGSGYTKEERTIDGDILAGETLDIEADFFTLRRVSIVSGTVWKVCDGGSPPCGPASQGLPNHPVTINNPTTGFSAAIQTDGGGRFVHESIIQETSAYRIIPSIGSDFSASPEDLTVSISTNGVNFWESSPGTPLEFVLTIVNGTLKGKVMKNGKPYSKGALVIATTYTGAFPTVLPNSVLSGEYTYSTVTETEGTYELRVATGVGDYTVYALTPDNPTTPVSVGPYTVPADSEVTAADLVIP